jgi:hypothetical protein
LRLLDVQTALQEAGDEEAHDLLCDQILDPLWSALQAASNEAPE